MFQSQVLRHSLASQQQPPSCPWLCPPTCQPCSTVRKSFQQHDPDHVPPLLQVPSAIYSNPSGLPRPFQPPRTMITLSSRPERTFSMSLPNSSSLHMPPTPGSLPSSLGPSRLPTPLPASPDIPFSPPRPSQPAPGRVCSGMRPTQLRAVTWDSSHQAPRGPCPAGPPEPIFS